MTKPTISLCMIVKNEERCLERCLESIKGVVSEIIIVDTGSTDHTVEIARKYTDKIYYFEWTNNFAEARNFGLNYATGDYILHLDADEYIGKGIEYLSEPLDKDYYFVRIRNELGFGTAEMHQFVRLFRNDPQLRYVGALHEQIDLLKHKNLQFGLHDSIIYHDGYLENVVKEKHKNDRNMKIIQAEVQKHPNAFNYFNLGVQYSLEGMHEKALGVLKKAYSMGQHLSYAQRILTFIIKSLMELNRYPEALQVGQDSALLYSNSADFQYRVGLIYEHLRYEKDAEQCFQKCLEIGEESSRTEFNHYEGLGSYLAHGKLTELYLRNGNIELAKKHFFLGVKEGPDLMFFTKLFTDLFPHLKGKEFVDALMKIWPLDSVKRIEQFVIYLYSIRHPGTLDLINCYDIDIPQEVQAWLGTLEGDLSKSEELWSHAQGVQEYHFRDLLLLSFLQKKMTLLKQYKHLFNIRGKEWKWWEGIVVGAKLNDAPISKELKTHWGNLCEDIIRLNHFVALEDLINSSNHPGLRYIIAEKLFRQGFAEVALDVIIESTFKEDNKQIYALVRSILIKMGQIGDATYYALQAYELDRSFSNGYELLKLYVDLKDHEQAEQIFSELKKLKPASPSLQDINFSEWVSQYYVKDNRAY
ncbi:glycosyltransferase [Paenibacillus terreus]|uniref:Glycosyltransferase n=1 Tax=Paenibacillus terreus TaxID=1387834 RepID=A0ABV5B9E3_9BACL